MPMNEEEFRERFGHPSQNDGLERANCTKVGEPGHYYCGMCDHRVPRFMICVDCYPHVIHYRPHDKKQ